MMTEQQAAAMTAETKAARIETLVRELDMLNRVQPHLKGCPASQNRARIAAREDELTVLETGYNLHEHFTAEEIQHAEEMGL